MIPFRLRHVLPVLVLAATAAPACAQEVQPRNPAERRALEVARLVDRGDPKEILAYVDSAFGGRMRQLPADAHLGFALGLHDRTRGLEPHGFQESSAELAVLRLRARLTEGWVALAVRVDSFAPHQVVGIGLREPQLSPDEVRGPRTDEEAAAELDAFLQRLAEAEVFSGAVLLAREGRVVYRGAFGQANKDFGVPNTLETKFNLGSMNKMFTAVGILKLAEQGRLLLDDSLARFLPDFPNPEAARKIRIEHLLTHTSGLGSYFNDEFFDASRARFRTVDDMMALARGDSLAFEPGTEWAYSNTGFLVLGKVIEVVTGEDYFDWIREHVYKPAGMASTDAYELDRVNPNLAVGYEKEFGAEGVTWRNNVFEHVIRGGPAGGGYSTVGDLLRFAEALRGGMLLSPRALELATTPKPLIHSPDYGYGFILGDGAWGHSGGFPGISSDLTVYPDGTVAIVLSNYGAGSFPVVTKLREIATAGR